MKSAWPQAEIWIGWSEVGIPKLSVIPHGLAWGRIQGYETLFCLKVGVAHKSKDEIKGNTSTRLVQAIELCNCAEVRLRAKHHNLRIAFVRPDGLYRAHTRGFRADDYNFHINFFTVDAARVYFNLIPQILASLRGAFAL